MSRPCTVSFVAAFALVASLAGPAPAAMAATSVAPGVTTQPASQTVYSGQTATFSAAASGTPAPSTQWQLSVNDGTSWLTIGGATSGTLTTGVVSTAVSGWQLRAVFTSPAGIVSSNPATLTVLASAPPVVTTQPVSQTVAAGQTATFTVAASGTPAPSTQWQLSLNSGASWLTVGGATSPSLTTGVVSTAASGWQLRAVVTNAAGTVVTNPAILTVVAASIPGVTVQPVSVTVTPGQTATFTAAAVGPPAPTVQWQLSLDGGTSWLTIGGATSTSLVTGPVSTAASGWQVRAVFTNAGGVTPTNPAILTVADPVAPTATAQPSSQHITAGQTVTVTASASGSPTPAVQWEVLLGGAWTAIPGATSDSYTSEALAVSDSGSELRAQFSNASGLVWTEPATISVVAAPTMPATGLYSTPQYTTAQVTTYSGLQYTTAPDANNVVEPVLLDIMEPPDAMTSPRPTIVEIHGGAFVGGSRTDQDGDAMQWALRGYVAVSIDYRLANIADAGNANEAVLAAKAIPDAQQSIRWLKANAATYGIDPTRMAMIGFSAGGALSLGTAVTSNVPYSGPLSQYPATIAAAVSTGAFLTPGLSQISVTSTEPAVMMFQYDYDVSTRVTSAYAFETCDWLRDAGNSCDEVDLAGSGHTTDLVPGGQWWTSELGPFMWRSLNLGS
jgi:acetyl esterase/lipase